MKKRDMENGRFRLFEIGSVKTLSALAGDEGMKYVNGCVDIDNRLHLMFEAQVDELSYRHVVIVLTVDWHAGTIQNRQVVSLGVHPFRPTHIEVLDGHYLLVDGCDDVGDDPNNAWILSLDGGVLDAFYLGRDIQQCIVRRSREIAIGFGDIGVFSLGCGTGVSIFNRRGGIRWVNTRCVISDNYALHDSGDRLWFYFYSQFILASTDKRFVSERRTTIRGSEGVLIHADRRHAVFSAPWWEQNVWLWVRRTNGKWKTVRKGVPMCDGRSLKIRKVNFARSKFFCTDENGVFYGGTIEEPPYTIRWYRQRGKKVRVRTYCI